MAEFNARLDRPIPGIDLIGFAHMRSLSIPGWVPSTPHSRTCLTIF